MYVLAAGAADGRGAAAPASWEALRPFLGTRGGPGFNNADLGLFVFQYGLDLLDLAAWRAPGAGRPVGRGARSPSRANAASAARPPTASPPTAASGACRPATAPPRPPDGYAYRAYSPAGPVDGTAHLTAALASVAHRPERVLRQPLRGRPRPRLAPAAATASAASTSTATGSAATWSASTPAPPCWRSTTTCMNDRVRQVFHGLPCVGRALGRLGFVRVATSLAA